MKDIQSIISQKELGFSGKYDMTVSSVGGSENARNAALLSLGNDSFGNSLRALAGPAAKAAGAALAGGVIAGPLGAALAGTGALVYNAITPSKDGIIK